MRDLTEEDRARIAAIRAEVAEEEAEAAAAEAAEAAEADKAVLSVRVPTYLAEKIKARANEEQIPTSAFVRRVLTQATDNPAPGVFTVKQIEEIVRRVNREQADERKAA